MRITKQFIDPVKHPVADFRFTPGENQTIRDNALKLRHLDPSVLGVLASALGREIHALRQAREWTADGSVEEQWRHEQMLTAALAYRAVDDALVWIHYDPAAQEEDGASSPE